MSTKSTMETSRRLLLAFFAEDKQAETALHRVLDEGFPMDRISVLGKADASGEDPLGLYYPSLGERIKGWGGIGALWGGLWGLVAGAAGMFLIPGTGAIAAAGPVVEALAGAGIGAGALASAAAMSQLGATIHRMGVPPEAIEEIQALVHQGHPLLMLILDQSELERWETLLRWNAPERLMSFPYAGLSDAVRGLV